MSTCLPQSSFLFDDWGKRIFFTCSARHDEMRLARLTNFVTDHRCHETTSSLIQPLALSCPSTAHTKSIGHLKSNAHTDHRCHETTSSLIQPLALSCPSKAHTKSIGHLKSNAHKNHELTNNQTLILKSPGHCHHTALLWNF